ncbi:MAG: DUF4252 domain-containing protein [Bacteroidetes bacterium]|jgi:hypothetical protein|nr:DUF4252 domain-containing protein [Bacteroidota bacterium]MDA0878875.1 DUF4252 domain-containing protein [Bacteroidota bacterium]MDA1115137.1 DUF4252 domain-containing protein [Bacteroidota bacterium]
MKTFIFTVLGLMLSLTITAQDLFSKYESMDGVTSGVINSKMFSMIASMDIDVDDPDAKTFMEMVNKIESVKLLVTGSQNISKNMVADTEAYIRKANLDELMRFKDGAQNVRFYVREGKDQNHVKELLMFITGLGEMLAGEDLSINGKTREVETVIVSIVGDIDLKQISKITSKMNLPGGEHLDKAGKKKQ